MPKKVLIAFPPGMLEQIDFVAQNEHRTRSDLIREAVRRYINEFKNAPGGMEVFAQVPAHPTPIKQQPKLFPHTPPVVRVPDEPPRYFGGI